MVACGGAPTASSDAPKPTPSLSVTRVVLASLETTESTSFRADVNVPETITATGPGASQLHGLAGQTLDLTMTVAAESRDRLQMRMTATVANRPVDVVSVLYDGAVYVSTDGGTTFKSVSINGASLPSQFASENALPYLQSVGSAVDEGPGTADGIAVEKYSATFDSAKVLNVMQCAFASLPAQAQQVLKGLPFNGGAIEVTIDHQGRLVTENGPIDASLDLSAVQPSLAGTTMHMHETVDSHFHDYGSRITVTKPAVRPGSAASFPQNHQRVLDTDWDAVYVHLGPGPAGASGCTTTSRPFPFSTRKRCPAMAVARPASGLIPRGTFTPV